MKPPEYIMDWVNLLTCYINDCWSRYADLIYQYALEDILAFLIERQGLLFPTGFPQRMFKAPTVLAEKWWFHVNRASRCASGLI